MVRVVFIPSFGTDSSLYDNLRSTAIITDKTIYTEWLPVSRNSTLAEYATLFISAYKITPEDILVGVSLGGVVAIEINKKVRVQKVIIISSIKTKVEKPRLFHLLYRTQAYKLFSPKFLKYGLDVLIPFYGRNVSSYGWFRRVFKASDNVFLKWALREIIAWKNEEIASNLVHIHGTRDPLFPFNNCSKIDHSILNGTHAMIRFHAPEIAHIIQLEINYLESV